MENNEYIGVVNTAKFRTAEMIFNEMTKRLDELENEAEQKKHELPEDSELRHFYDGKILAFSSAKLYVLGFAVQFEYELCKEIGVFDDAEKEEIT